MKPIPYATQDIDTKDVDAVVSVLRSEWLTQGLVIERFEQAVAQRCGGAHAVAVSSATAGLHLACLALGLAPGHRLWTTPNTFVASANCARYCGADVDFVDIDERTRNLSIDALERKLGDAGRRNALPHVVIAVHYAGLPPDMARIAALADRYGFRVIEDASHAIGAIYEDGTPVGSGKYSDLTVFSFHAVKVLTTGEGGMVLGRDRALAARVRLLRSHGITRDPSEMEGDSEGGWYYQQVDLGYNYRMTEFQAALGLAQLGRLSGFLEQRRRWVDAYKARLRKLPVTLPSEDGSARSSWHLYVVELANPSVRRHVFDVMRAEGILVNVHYIPVHLHPYYRKLNFGPGDFPAAERFYGRALSLPMHTRLIAEDHERVCRTFTEALEASSP
jgi:UDP-4-amino-4,6-dideoxy-N-acetyl-beta-L-altrosamine transaminase